MTESYIRFWKDRFYSCHSVFEQLIMNIGVLSKGTALFNHLSHSSRGNMVSVLVIMKATGTPQPTSSCLMTIECRNAFRLLSKAQHILCVESRHKSDEYRRRRLSCQLVQNAKKKSFGRAALLSELILISLKRDMRPASSITSPCLLRLFQQSVSYCAIPFKYAER